MNLFFCIIFLLTWYNFTFLKTSLCLTKPKTSNAFVCSLGLAETSYHELSIFSTFHFEWVGHQCKLSCTGTTHRLKAERHQSARWSSRFANVLDLRCTGKSAQINSPFNKFKHCLCPLHK